MSLDDKNTTLLIVLDSQEMPECSLWFDDHPANLA